MSTTTPTWWVSTKDANGNPFCFICHEPVAQEGETCSKGCYTHFLLAVLDSPGLVSMENLLDLEDQPWHTQGDET